MKKSVKIMSSILAVLMIVAMLPLSAAAKTLTTTNTSASLDDLDLLLELDNLGATPGANSDSSVTYTHIWNYNTNATLDSEGWMTASATNTGAKWYTYGGATNLSLTGEEQYVISFTAEPSKVPTQYGFIFDWHKDKEDNENYSNGVLYGEGYYYQARGRNFYNVEETTRTWVRDRIPTTDTSNDMMGAQNYILTIDGYTVTLYREGVKVFSCAMPGYYNYLAIGCRVRYATDYSNANVDKDEQLAKMTNIKVYEGTYEPTVNNYNEGDMLLTMDTPIKADTATSEFEDIKVNNVSYYYLNNAMLGTDAATLYEGYTGSEATDTILTEVDDEGNTTYPDYNMYAGVTTNLPLNASSKYTIEFSMKKHIAANLAFYFSGSRYDFADGFYVYTNSLTSIRGTSSTYYGDGVNFSDVDATSFKVGEDYAKFAVEINGYKYTVYKDDIAVATYDVSTKGEYATPYLSLALRVSANGEDMTNECAVASIKDVTVYAGNTLAEDTVQFKKDGNVIQSGMYEAGDVIEAFPTVEVAEGKLLKWFYEGTNIIVNAPYTVTHNVVIEAREIDPYAIDVAGYQYTAATENKQSVRFISTIHSLQASEVGFNVRAVYKDADGNIKNDKEWQKKSTVVYTSINATTNGTVESITAAELGGTYLIALAVDNVPSNYEQIDFYVQSYITVDGVVKTSDEVRFTMSNGVANTTLSALEVPES